MPPNAPSPFFFNLIPPKWSIHPVLSPRLQSDMRLPVRKEKIKMPFVVHLNSVLMISLLLSSLVVQLLSLFLIKCN